MSDNTTGQKLDGDKLRFSLLPWRSVAELVKVLEFGAAKYDVDNWQRVENAESRYWDAAMRHLIAIKEGEAVDEESGLSHWAHAGCCCLFGAWFGLVGKPEIKVKFPYDPKQGRDLARAVENSLKLHCNYCGSADCLPSGECSECGALND